MAFWGIEVKPGKPVTHSFEKVRKRLRISQATLGIGTAVKKSLVQCNIGNKSPVFICALLPEKTESCHLDLEFEEADDVVFSVIGPQSVYLTGYYVGNYQHSALHSDTESYGEDIANTETEQSNHDSDGDEYDDSFIDDDDPVISPPSPVPSNGVKEKILDESKRERKGSKRLQRQMVLSSDSDEQTTSPETEDEDKLPFSVLFREKAANHLASEVEEKTDEVTAQINENDGKADSGGSVHLSEEKADAANLLQETNRKNLPCNASFPSDEAQPEKETESNDSGNLIKQDGACEDNIAHHCDTLINDEDQKNVTRVDDKCGNLHTRKEEDKSELGPLNKTKLKRKRKQDSDGLEGHLGKHEKALKQDKVLQPDAEGDIKHQDLEPNRPNLRKTTKLNVDGESHLVHSTGSVDGPGLKKRKKGGMKEKSNGSNETATNDILLNDQLKENVVEVGKDIDNLPATTADKKSNADEDTNFDLLADGSQPEERKRKKKKDKAKENIDVSLLSANESEKPSKPCQVRSLSNGLVIEELALGNQDGKIAALGRKVKVYYTGMLKESGRVIKSNIGKAPYKFRLDDKEIIEGWKVGVEGMRVGDKRRLTIPPLMGYGEQGDGENVPPNSWLVFDIELVHVR